jgi:hypothetical protein
MKENIEMASGCGADFVAILASLAGFAALLAMLLILLGG